ncbi:Protein SPIRAL1 [Hirschfeldia incana]|nr:Protein SPIRAL1 [Hirschfeldia incana]KAJ0252880.1 Protein SPIRAL1 [Hirschfeldia incana]
MGRGNSCGGGQSSLNYLFGGSGDAPPPPPKPAPAPSAEPNNATAAPAPAPAPAAVTATALSTATTSVEPAELNKQIPAGIKTPDRPSTKVHAAPGGGSSLDYLFTGGK